MHDNEYVLTQKEAADFLNVSTKSISRYRKRGLPFKLILNPVTGKQEVRFRRADLERWHEGRQLLATYGRDGEEAAAPGPQAGGRPSPVPRADDQGFLNELLAVYREEIEILRDQVAIVTAVKPERPHHGVAYERFLPGGPIALIRKTRGGALRRRRGR